MQIPEDHFRLWAFAIVAEVAYDADGKEMYEGLSNQISKLLSFADKEGNDYLLCELLMTRVKMKMMEKGTVESESVSIEIKKPGLCRLFLMLFY